MRLWRRKPEPPVIPAYRPPEPLPLFTPKPKDEGIEVVEEQDLTQTAVHRILKLFGRE